MTTEIKIPKSMLKKLLAQKGMRVSVEAITAFEKKFREWSLEISEKATQKCLESRRKTITPQDLE